jgi:hypothetical protein
VRRTRAGPAGFEQPVAHRASRTLAAQYVVRVIKPQTGETATGAGMRDAVGATRVALPWDFRAGRKPAASSVELWLGWSGDKELELSEHPVFY